MNPLSINKRLGDIDDAAVTTDANGTISGKLRGLVMLLKSVSDRVPTTLGQKTKANSLSVTVASDQDPVDVTGPLTDAELRAAAVNVAQQNAISTITATIALGESLSGAIDCGAGQSALAILMPAAWDAANLTVQGSADGVTWGNLYDEYGVEVTLTAAAGRWIRLNPAEWAATRYLKLRSGTAATPVAQTAERELTVIVRGV